ncbi:hypothetical protein OHV05_00875 [Kitasatospora sp. NBC_00070]|uniref:Acg family FMN-binding oxidoreductase n=1 Tax=Kitasatospora sp. NBC_00070 TaxID=2975962 RepID=UPI00324BF276
MSVLTLDAIVLEKLLSAAVAAPSVHNTQPWRFRLRPETSTLEVRARPEHLLTAADPQGRALHISVGAAILNLRIAARHLGWAPEIRLLPDPGEADLLATVGLDRPVRTEPLRVAELFEAIWHRHTIRTPFTGEPVPPAVLDELTRAARAEGAVLHLPDRTETHRLLGLTAEAERRNTTDPARSAESRSWLREPGAPALGIPDAALGPQDATGRLPVRDFAAIRPADHLPPAAFEAEPRIAVLTTANDRPIDWLRAGLALEHLLLTATVHQVRASLLHQVMEWPQLRWEARDSEQGPEHVQMLVRLGYGPEGAPTPRLTVAEVLDSDGGLRGLPPG